MVQPPSEIESYRQMVRRHLNERRIPSRFIFAGPGAERQIEYGYENPEAYNDGRSVHEARALTNYFRSAIPDQLCDIGTNQGIHTSQLLATLDAVGALPMRYLAIDFSGRLLEATKQRTEQLLPADATFKRWNVEAGRTTIIDDWRSETGTVLACLFGNTLGNVEDVTDTLINLRHSCQDGDYLALGIYLASIMHPEGALIGYDTPEIREAILEPFRSVGVSDRDVQLRIELDKDTHSVLGTAVVLRSFDHDDLHLPVGAEINCFISRRFTQPVLGGALQTAGWKPVHEALQSSNDYLVLVAQAEPLD